MQCFCLFFIQNPALYLALLTSIGAVAKIHFPQLFFFLLPFFFKKGIFGTLLAAFLFAFPFSFPPIPEEGITGNARIAIDQISLRKGSHGASWVYKGTIQHFTNGKLILKNVPFFLSFPEGKKNRPLASNDYEVLCKIKPGKGNQVFLKPYPRAEWKIHKRFSLNEWRFSMKQKVKRWIERRFSSEATLSFLAGLVIGEFDDKQLKRDFDRFGLLHLLAISGFHFNILASLLTLFLRPFFSTRGVAFLLILLLSAYFIFLGWGPSIIRAWLTLLLYLGAFFQERFSSPLNSLGIAVLLSLMIDPLLIENLGFQFSFLTTGAILLGLKPFAHLLNILFPKRPLKAVLEWPKKDQLVYLLLAYLKNGIAMTLVTTCIALPIGLYYFEKFPFLSLFYNIFFPFLVSISLTLLLLGSLLFFIPPLANAMHYLNDYFTSFILNMTYDIPKSDHFFLYVTKPHLLYIILYMVALFLTSIYFQKYKNHLKYNTQ